MAADPPAQFPAFYLIVPINLDMPMLEFPKGISQMLLTPRMHPPLWLPLAPGHSRCSGTAFGGGEDPDHCRNETFLAGM